MRLETAFLCDGATVRERLLHVLGAGITKLARPQLPAVLGLDLAMLFVAESEDDLGRNYELRMQIVHADAPDAAIAEITAPFGLAPGEIQRPEPFLPLVFPLRLIALTQSGFHHLVIILDGEELRRIEFLLQLEPMPDVTPSAEMVPELDT